MSHNHHHQAVDNLINVFVRASHDLTIVHSKLDQEFQQIYPDNDLIDKAQTTLVGNCNLIQKMNASLGESTNGDADDVLVDFNQIIDEWTMQVRSRTVEETEEADKEDINKMLLFIPLEDFSCSSWLCSDLTKPRHIIYTVL